MSVKNITKLKMIDHPSHDCRPAAVYVFHDPDRPDELLWTCGWREIYHNEVQA